MRIGLALIALGVGCSDVGGPVSPEPAAPPSAHRPGASPRCPEGMVPIPGPDAPAYCIDAYEVSVPEGLTVEDLVGPSPRGEGVVSRAGARPLTGVNFTQAVGLCARTPVEARDGRRLGFKRMATSSEWEDAGDGLIGPGGRAWPWGDEPVEGRCALPGPGGPPVQPVTGQQEGCCSPQGVCDQIGNVWEWTESGARFDVAAWLEASRAVAPGFEVGSAGELLFKGAELPPDWSVGLGRAGAQSVRVGEGGRVQVEVRRDDLLRGAIVLSRVMPPRAEWGGWMLPVKVELPPGADDPVVVGVQVLTEMDKAPIPDKKGCAAYVGSLAECTFAQSKPGHLPDFSGSIGFRCVADPLPP